MVVNVQVLLEVVGNACCCLLVKVLQQCWSRAGLRKQAK